MKRTVYVLLLMIFTFASSCATDRPVTLVKENARGFEKLGHEHYNRGDFEGAILFFLLAGDLMMQYKMVFKKSQNTTGPVPVERNVTDN